MLALRLILFVQVDGASIVAGSVYGCGTLPKRGTICYYGGADVDATVEYVKGRHAANLIDDPAFLANVPVHLFHGQLDEVITRPCMKDVRQQLQNFVPSRLIKVIFNTSATHVWSVDHGTCKCGACGWTGTPLCCDVNNCAYDLSGDLLRHIYEPNQVVKPRTAAVEDNLFWVNQTAWIPAWTPDATFSPTGAAFMKWGLLYVPTNCYGAKLASCRVHVNYHGCTKKLYPRRKLWAHNLDLNEYGEANDIIFFYPQAAGNKTTTGVRVCLFVCLFATSADDFALQFGCYAQVGCWNWGFPKDDKLWDTRQSVQLRTVVNIVDNLDRAFATAKNYSDAQVTRCCAQQRSVAPHRLCCKLAPRMARAHT